MRRGTAFRIPETMGAEVKHIEKAPLALPLGELSPQVTERVLRRFLNDNVNWHHQRWPSPSELRSATSPKGRGKRDVSTDSPIVPTMFYAAPLTLVSLACGRASFPQGKLLYLVGRRTVRILRRDIRKVPGTAHRPFPTVSLVGGSIQPHRLYSERGGRQIAAPTCAVPFIRLGGTAFSRCFRHCRQP